MFSGNSDAKTHAPKFMFDEKKMGFKSITADAQARKGDLFLIRKTNAVPFDPNAGWKEGDMIPDHITSREDATGSAADNNATVLERWHVDGGADPAAGLGQCR